VPKIVDQPRQLTVTVRTEPLSASSAQGEAWTALWVLLLSRDSLEDGKTVLQSTEGHFAQKTLRCHGRIPEGTNGRK
jgi:hypothetical protein